MIGFPKHNNVLVFNERPTHLAALCLVLAVLIGSNVYLENELIKKIDQAELIDGCEKESEKEQQELEQELDVDDFISAFVNNLSGSFIDNHLTSLDKILWMNHFASPITPPPESLLS